MTTDDGRLRDVYRGGMSRPSTPHLDEAQWEHLAMGELAAPDRERAMDHIVTCAECGGIYRGLHQLHDGARAFDPAVPAEPHHASPVASRALYALAAMLALIIASAVGYRVIAPTEPAVVNEPPSPGPLRPLAQMAVEAPEVRLSASRALATRGAGSEADMFLDDFGRAIAPFRERRYTEAARALEPVAAKYEKAWEPAFYGGASLLLAGDAAAAVEVLREAEDRADTDPMRDEIRWYLAAALQRAGRGQEALALVGALCEGTSAWRDRACRALRPAN